MEWTLVWLVGAAASAGAVQGASGFGFTLVAAPACSLFLPAEAVVGTVARLALAVDLALARLDGGEADRRQFRAYALPAVAAVPLALVVARTVPGSALVVGGGAIAVLGAMLLGSDGARAGRCAEVDRADDGDVGLALDSTGFPAADVRKRRGAGRSASPSLAGAAGFASGLLGVTTGLSGPPVALHAARVSSSSGRTRGTLALFFVGVDGLTVMANPTAVAVPTLLAMVPAALVGMAAGRLLAGAIPARTAQRLVAVLVGSTGAVALFGQVI